MSECFYCKHCFRDDNYGECCLCENSEHYTRSWDLDWRIVTDCKYFDDIRNLLGKTIRGGMMTEEQETIVIKLTPKYWGYEAEVVSDDE